MRTIASLSIAVALTACTSAEDRRPQPIEVGNAALGIARFEIKDTPTLTSVVGRDESGVEVGRVELVHGRFTLSEVFAEGYADPNVDGRRLHVTVQGQEMQFETVGYAPLLRLPAHPSSQDAIAQILADPHVKPVLDHWKLGFKGAEVGEIGYDGIIQEYASGIVDCSFSSTCALPNGQTATACPNVQQAAAGDNGTDNVVVQCCPNNNRLIRKTCGASDGAVSECGDAPTGSGPCSACPFYSVPAAQCRVIGSSDYFGWPFICGYQNNCPNVPGPDFSLACCTCIPDCSLEGRTWDIQSCSCSGGLDP